MCHLQRKMKTEESVHRHTVKCLNYIPVKIMQLESTVTKCKKTNKMKAQYICENCDILQLFLESFHLNAMEC